MSSYLSGLLTTTTSRYASLRSLIPSSASEADGDTPDDTHLCRVLRAYYIEKGRALPSWLPPDPRSAQPAQNLYGQPTSNVGAGYGGLNASGGGGGNKLGSLWDREPSNGPAPTQPTSLRQQGRGPSSNNLRGGHAARDPMIRSQTTTSAETVQARPLPSQKAGSYQTSTPPPSAGSGSAQDRLKQRLWGAARAANPVVSAPPNQSAPAQQQRTPAGRDGDRPFVAATAPWASTEDEYARGGYGRGRTGLPNGLALPRRPGGGLPNGPRTMR